MSCINCEKFFKNPATDLVVGAFAGGGAALVGTIYSATGVLKNVTVPHGLLFGVTFGVVFVVTLETIGCLLGEDAITGDRSTDEFIHIIASAIIAAVAASLIVGAITGGAFTVTAGLAIAATTVTALIGLITLLDKCCK